MSNIRSSLTESIAQFYEAVISDLDRTPWHHDGATVCVSRIAIPARVGVRGIAARERHGDYASLYEEPDKDQVREIIAWEQGLPNVRRAALLGGPGSGKSFVIRLTALALARQGLAEIQARTIPLEQLPLPVVVNLRELARGNQPDDMGAMLLDALSVRYPVRGHLEAWCREKLRSLDCWLLMDALDEVDDNRRPRIIEFLRTIDTQGWQCRVIMTCQTANYHPGLLLWPKFTEYELAPLDLSEIQTFIGQWFGEQDPRAERLSAAIGVDRVLQGFCRSPLLATLLCLASEELHEEPSRLALYQQVLHGLLRRWRVEEEPTNALHIDDLVYLLQTMAWRLFVAFPGANRFTSKQVVDAIASANRGGRMEASAREIRDELVQAGLMVCADLNAEGEHQLSFLHRLIFECLVADHLRRAVMQAGW